MGNAEWETFPDDRPQDREGAPSRIVRTTGPWSNEEEAHAAFYEIAQADPRFSHVYHEVDGIYTARMPLDQEKTARIDFVLIPSQDLIAAGWCHDPIGVEVKAPGSKAGRALAQCIDYTRAVFKPNAFNMPLSMVFLFECGVIGGDLESITTQNRVGTCRLAGNRTLRFFRGSSEIVSLSDPRRNFLQLRKVGSR